VRQSLSVGHLADMVRIAEFMLGNLDRAVARVDHIVRAKDALFESSAIGYELHHRAGRIDTLDRVIGYV
jgi:hypothetical protein